jgi:segregation and condensation protein A
MPTDVITLEQAWPDGEGPLRAAPADEDALVVDVDGFEGPLDLLLQLARNQSVDLSKISILSLAEQYIAFIERARAMRLEIAADYLVMAAWLAYLKSRLLIPAPPRDDDEPDTAGMAERLAFRLQRLQAMRDAAAKIMDRQQAGRDVFGRGSPEPLVFAVTPEYTDNLIDLLKAYSERRQRKLRHQAYRVQRQPVWSIKDARLTLERMLGRMDDWTALDGWLVGYLGDPGLRASVLASSFTASLELAREGALEMRQDEAFRPILMRRKPRAA